MPTISEEAKGYEPMQTKNIADLEVVPTDVEITKKSFTKEDGTEFEIRVISIDNVDYRVPTIVLKSLKALIEEKSDLKTFKVKRSGEGLKTVYTLIPLG